MTETSDFDQLFRQYYEPLFHFAHQFISDDEDCHDIVSSAYESVWNNYASIEKDCAKRYLYAIVKNKAIDFLRKNNLRCNYVKYVSVIGEHEIDDGFTDHAQLHKRGLGVAVAVMFGKRTEIR